VPNFLEKGIKVITVLGVIRQVVGDQVFISALL
jgi:hypothetical protein